MTRYAVLRLESARTLIVKEPASPVVIALILEEDLVAEQLRHLCAATLFSPVMVEAEVLSWVWDPAKQGFRARLTDVEILPKVPRPKESRKSREGIAKRRRGGAVVEFD